MTSAGGTDCLDITGLRVSRGGRQVLHDVDLTVEPGSVTALLGANGAGKSSLVLTVAGVLRPSAGQIVACGVHLAGRRPEQVRAAGVCAVPEGHRVLADLTVMENLTVAGSRMRKAALGRAVDGALHVLPHLATLTDRPARTLSGGEQQMLAIAQALVAGPRFLLVDELSLGLAPVVVARLVPVLQKLAADGVGVLLIEQFVHVALGVAGRAYVLSRGRITYSGGAGGLADQPDLLHAAYLGLLGTGAAP